MKKHLFLLYVELAIFIPTILYPIFTNLPYADSIYVNEPVRLSFRLAENQDLEWLYTINVLWQMREAPSFSVDRLKIVKYDAQNLNKEYEVVLPEGTFSFRMDFIQRHGCAISGQCPRLVDIRFGSQELTEDDIQQVRYPENVTPMRLYRPRTNGHFLHYILTSIILFIVIAVVISLAIVKGARHAVGSSMHPSAAGTELEGKVSRFAFRGNGC